MNLGVTNRSSVEPWLMVFWSSLSVSLNILSIEVNILDFTYPNSKCQENSITVKK